MSESDCLGLYTSPLVRCCRPLYSPALGFLCYYSCKTRKNACKESVSNLKPQNTDSICIHEVECRESLVFAKKKEKILNNK